jgi:hypothetical protein
MSENTTSTSNGGEAKEPKESRRKLYDTLEAAKAEVPQGKGGKPFQGRVYAVKNAAGELAGFAWGNSVDGAIVTAARAAGWSAEVAEPKGGGPVTKERVAVKLAEFSDEELAEMGLSRKKGKK